MNSTFLIRSSVTALYIFYLIALTITLFTEYFHETLVVCLSLHFGGLLGGLVFYYYTGAEWSNPYPRDKLGFYRDFIILTDTAQFLAWVYAMISLILEYDSEILLTIAGTLAYIGIAICFTKFYLIAYA